MWLALLSAAWCALQSARSAFSGHTRRLRLTSPSGEQVRSWCLCVCLCLSVSVCVCVKRACVILSCFWFGFSEIKRSCFKDSFSSRGHKCIKRCPPIKLSQFLNQLCANKCNEVLTCSLSQGQCVSCVSWHSCQVRSKYGFICKWVVFVQCSEEKAGLKVDFSACKVTLLR